ncbi:DUF4282 domain-containing protein [Rubripirellula sp.]|nr:DUF4282 domain-containing protein [Rubripirellula sp.]MDB4621534.1 DUF4282 domain-containing protein [Rubripirellula sp.]
MSKQESGWSLRHRDNIEHGPFDLHDLILAAQTGNIAPDTMLRHPKHTSNQWVIATRVTAIGKALSEENPQSATHRQTTSEPKTQPSTKKTLLAHQTPTHAPTTETPPRKTKSIFRRDHAEVVPEPENKTTRLSDKPNPNKKLAPPASEADTNKQGLNIRNWHDEKLSVPRTLPDAFFALFDFRFRFFITPWIIKILWAIGITIALLMVLRLGYDNLISPNLSVEVDPEQDNRSWQFEPLEGKPFFSFPAVRYLMFVLVIFCSVLMLRVICEACIVMFRIAGNLTEIKAIMKEKHE